MLDELVAGRLQPRVGEHPLPVRRGPVAKGHPRVERGDERTDHDRQQGRRGRGDSQPEQAAGDSVRSEHCISRSARSIGTVGRCVSRPVGPSGASGDLPARPFRAVRSGARNRSRDGRAKNIHTGRDRRRAARRSCRAAAAWGRTTRACWLPTDSGRTSGPRRCCRRCSPTAGTGRTPSGWPSTS